VRPQRQDASQLRTPVVSGHGRGRPCAAAGAGGMAPNPPAVRSVPIRSLLAAICHCRFPSIGCAGSLARGPRTGIGYAAPQPLSPQVHHVPTMPWRMVACAVSFARCRS
jgi:hypothetical protein